MREISIPNNLKIAENYSELYDELKRVILSEASASASLLVISGINSNDLITRELCEDLEKDSELDLNIQAETLEIKKESLENNPYIDLASKSDLVIGVGGGKVLDFAKYLTAQAKKKFISIPTLISHDGICSPVAVLHGKSLGAVMPSALVVPLYIIQDSPLKYIQAGVGDLVANLSSLEDWYIANKYNNEELDDFAIMLSKKSAINILQRLSHAQSSGKLNDKNAEEFLYSTSFLKALIESLTLSGIAMSIAGNSRPCSGAEHMISHAIDEIYGANKISLHGIQVAVATVYLEEKRQEKFIDHDYSIKEILELAKMPTSFAELGINETEFEKILEQAPKTRAGRYTIFDLLSIKTKG